MRAFEQIALKTRDITQRIKDVGPIYPFNGHMTRNAEPTKWVLDRVHAVNIYLHPDYSCAAVGTGFEVQLAFNYDLIPGRELELIQLLSGETVQLRGDESDNEGLSHLGYHIPDADDLRRECEWWSVLKRTVVQVSVTTDHSGTSKRYMYAFIDTREQIGAYTKVISRVSYPRAIDSLVGEFSRVNDLR
jgi:hypothetical protein